MEVGQIGDGEDEIWSWNSWMHDDVKSPLFTTTTTTKPFSPKQVGVG
jgi:hypothetical protein